LTGNPGQRRRRIAKKKQQDQPSSTQQATPAAPPLMPDTTNPWITVTRSASRRRRSQSTDAAHTSPIPPGHITIPSHTANFLFHDKPAQQPTPEPQSLPTSPENQLPPHAYWTADAVINPDTGAAQEYAQLKLGAEQEAWIDAASDEIGRLAQGVKPHMPHGTNTMHFIPVTALPPDRKATYLRVCANYRPHKANKHRI
jgi:hypothetical protein